MSKKRPNLKISIDIDGYQDGNHVELTLSEKLQNAVDNLEGKIRSYPVTQQRTRRKDVRIRKNKEEIIFIDQLSSDEWAKKEEKKRTIYENKFVEESAPHDVHRLYKTLGVSSNSRKRKIRGTRLGAIHLHGCGNFTTKDVFDYFQGFGPGGIEWISDNTCNVLWANQSSSIRAMLIKTYEHSELQTVQAVHNSGIKAEKTDDEAMDISINAEIKSEEDEDDFDLNDAPPVTALDDITSSSPTHDLISTAENDDVISSPRDNLSEDTDHENSKEIIPEKEIEKVKICIPPGKWRIACPHPNAPLLFARFATEDDKKVLDNEQKSVTDCITSQSDGEATVIEDIRYINEPGSVSDEVMDVDRNMSKSHHRSRRKHKIKHTSESESDQEEYYDEDDENHVVGLRDRIGSGFVKKQRTMRMYADDVEQEIKHKRVSSNVLSRIKRSRDIFEDNEDDELLSKPKPSSLWQESLTNPCDLRTKIRNRKEKEPSNNYGYIKYPQMNPVADTRRTMRDYVDLDYPEFPPLIEKWP